jgi:hypothetical protein
MSIENPDWRLEIWHEGAKAADIRNDEFRLVIADLVQFEANQRKAAQAAQAAAEAAQVAAEAAETEAEAGDDDEGEVVDSFTEAAMCWAHFAAAALHRKEATPESAAMLADELLDEYSKRFTDAA